MKVDSYNPAGEKSGQLELSKAVFGVEPNAQILAQYRRVYLANQRRAKAKTKTRGEVTGSGKKIWRQKGTGRARHGDRYANIFVGGGVAHGPTGQENYSLKMSRKMRRAALVSALSDKLQKKQVWMVANLAQIEPKTKSASVLLKKLELIGKKVTVVCGPTSEGVYRAFRNLAGVVVVPAAQLNAYDVMAGGRMVIMTEAVGVLTEPSVGTKTAAKSIEKKAEKLVKKKKENNGS